MYVNAIQACGGQMTANGRRLRTGGGLLWNIIKAREPKAYKEIMKKAKEFEKQFKQPYNRQPPTNQSKVEPSQVFAATSEDATPAKFSNDLQHVSEMTEMTEMPEVQTRDNQSNPRSEHVSVHDRLRVPVSYDDDLLTGEPKDDAI
ncbi:putative phosphorylated adapter RNA export RNA-binding protein [Rosa chinensis]|uniref:Phosphorylated adapter RNA export protein n=1 Tax=Rosa chinensis TaxID=74649 RepID=A0A2P6Q178_ROSCH|nr:putative phosphorylated adapter RNA export RNA-binding protein [Rosa chinensis]